MITHYQSLAIDALTPGQYQPRVEFHPKALEELAQSIQQQGLLEPLIVREIASGWYEILAGERRWRAAKSIGLKALPCLVGQYTDEQAATLALVENVQRENLTLLEEARGYQRLMKEFHFQQQDIADLVGKSRSHIANLIRVLSLSESVQALIREGELTLGHARLLVVLEEKEQWALARRVVDKQWSVRQLEAYLKKPSQREEIANGAHPSRDIARLQESLSEQLGAPVQIRSEEKQGGWLAVQFFDNDTLAGLLERMGLTQE